jgi:cytoskeletal protein CcmA (bactofilin family)
MWKGWQSMMTLLEVLAMVTLAGLGVMFYRRRIRRGSALALVLAGFSMVLALPTSASATERRGGQNPTVGKDETIKGDVYLHGERVRVEGTVDGDVIAAGKDIDIDGHVTGDVISAGRYLRIRGTVDGNIRSVGNTAVISGTLGKNITWFGDAVTVDATGKVGGGITMFGGTLAIDGHLNRDVLFYGEELNVNGSVGGGIREKGNMMIIGSNAQVDGAVKFEGNKPAEVSPGAKLASAVEFKQMQHKHDYREGGYYVWQVIWAAAFILFGLVLFALMPKFSQDAVGSAEHYGAAAGLGVLVLFGVPIAACIACITVVGIFIGVSTFLLWFASLFFAQVVVGAVIGQWLMGRTNELWPLIGRMTVGLILLRLCTTIPHIGGWVKLAAILWGIGALSLALYRRFQPMIAPSAPPAPYAPPIPPNTTVGGALPA